MPRSISFFVSRISLKMFAVSLASCILTPLHAADQTPRSSKSPTFEKDIRPILKTHCVQCHGEAGKKEGKLDVRLRRLIHQGGESGAAIQPGKPEKS